MTNDSVNDVWISHILSYVVKLYCVSVLVALKEIQFKIDSETNHFHNRVAAESQKPWVDIGVWVHHSTIEFVDDVF